MSRPLVSVVMSTYQRAHLLARSLVCYEMMDFPLDRFELIVIDDHSSDGTHGLVIEWSQRTRIKATILTPSPKLSKWQDCGAVLNHGIRAAMGKYILMTHPEVMVGRTTVKECYEALDAWELKNREVDRPLYDEKGNMLGIVKSPIGPFANAKVYYLSQQDQSKIDTVDWLKDGPIAVREIDGFYRDDMNGNPDYRHETTDQIGTPGFHLKDWGSWVFGGFSRETWKRLGGMLETANWGSVDVALMERRRTLQIPIITPVEAHAIVIHQNHDGPGDVITPRSEEIWKKELSHVDLRNPVKLVYPAVNNLWG